MNGFRAYATRYFARLLPIMTQLALIGSAVIVSYGYPFLFGLSAYGSFAAASALTFIVQRIVDLIAETTISEREPLKLVKSSAIVAAIALGLLLTTRALIPAVMAVPFNLLLFVSVFLSTVTLNLTFQVGTPVIQFLYAVSFGGFNLGVTLAWYMLGRVDLLMALVVVNLLGFATGVTLLSMTRRRECAPVQQTAQSTNAAVLRQLPFRVMYAAFQIVATYGAVMLASLHLPAEEIGTLRLLTTFAVLGYTLSPVNSKALYAISREVTVPADLAHALRPYRPMFFVLGAGWLSAAIMIGWTGAAAQGHLYLYALAIYPIVLFSSVFEKVLLNHKGLIPLGAAVGCCAAATATALFFCQRIEAYALTLTCAIAAYPYVLAISFARGFLLPAALVGLLAGSGLLLISAHWLSAALALGVGIVAALLVGRKFGWTR
jgi:hypothetical protein